LGKHIGFDDAMFHCLDPGGPLERGHFITEAPDWVVIEALEKWRHRYNPELAPLWNAADKNGGAGVGTEILRPDSRNRMRFYREIVAATGIEQFMWCHLEVHGARVATVSLGRRGGPIFSDADQHRLIEVRDVLALAEKVYRSCPRAMDDEVQS